MVINIKLLKRLRTRFLRMRPEHFNMQIIANRTDCGTAMCIAGHVLELAGYSRKLRPKDDRTDILDFDFFTPKGRKVNNPLSAAAKEIGITYRPVNANKAYRLFHDWELETPKDAAERIQKLIDEAQRMTGEWVEEG